MNLGLENRAMAPTLVNTTSSRSHTVLTVVVEQRGKVGDMLRFEREKERSRKRRENDDFGEEEEEVDQLGGLLNGSSKEQEEEEDQLGYTRTIRGKLLMVDLAGYSLFMKILNTISLFLKLFRFREGEEDHF